MIEKQSVPFGPPDSAVVDLISENRLAPHVHEGVQKPGQLRVRHEFRDPTSYELAILRGLQHQPHIYGGTVPAGVIRERRVKNRAARKARRANRIARQR